MFIDQHSADLAAQQQADQHSSDGVKSRRQAIATWARAAGRAFAPAAAIGAAGAAVMSMPGQRASASPMDVPADVDPGSLVAKLASRVSFGVTPELLAEANTLGYDAFLERQLNPESIPESASTTAYLGAIPALTVQPAQLWDETLFPSDELLANQLTEATIYRASFSSRQLLERMVEFWHDHFNFDLA
ncbi:MAG: DUF1800 domain-containing protein, partial [Phycisphaerales bacterium]|nr:DUF1800 domain-containing protein [Phycisphaerales bacterium]